MSSKESHGSDTSCANTGGDSASRQLEHSGEMVTQTGGCCSTQRSSDSECGSERASPDTPPTSPPKESSNGKHTKSAETERVLKKVSDIKPGKYVKLLAKYTKHLTWSNDPNDLDLYGAFADDEPNLASDFNLTGLQPIVKKKKGDTYIMRDVNHVYYVWDPWDGAMLKVPSEYIDDAGEDGGEWNDGLRDVEKIVRNILRNLHWIMEEAQEVYG